MRTIVIGAGAVGNATAYCLHKVGHEVTVIERQAGAALGTNFGNDGTVWLCDPRDCAPVNRMYAGYFTTNRPTRTVLGTTFMFKCRIEMKAVAYKPGAGGS